ncbi:hypothetical protein PLICRDRAFT_206669 [Plicaturopsis crispa FD-325 SS-3]|nr:hypothetical protein PLICRDRAFT_206669 [Plicaturopsis crispa FD-325 SS-3]
MLQHWDVLPILFLLLPSFVLASSFENTAIVRTVELGGALVHVTTTYAAKALEPNADSYTIALSQDEKSKTSFFEVTIKGQRTPLKWETHGLETGDDVHLIDVALPKPLGLNETVNLVLDTVQTHAARPWPERAAQSEEQALKYGAGLFVLSPYHTAVQRTKFRAPSPKIISYTEPTDLEAYTLDNVATKAGSTITYGPYKNIAPSATKAFVDENQKSLTIHYNFDHPVLEVTKLKRSAEISHWGSNLNIQDEIHLHNAGPELKGHFSRLEHQTQSFYQRRSPHVLQQFVLHLPAGIRNTYYYDLIGNVSTSRLRTAPAVSKNSAANQYSVLELKPRYPILGGWNYSFTLGWDAPLEHSASWDAEKGRYIVAVPIMTQIPSAVVDEAEVKIILPEGATDVEVFPPFPAVKNTISTHITYLDTIGRPALTFEYKQLTDKHTGIIYVAYKVPFTAHLKKPLAVATAFLAVFALALGGRRVDLRLHKK